MRRKSALHHSALPDRVCETRPTPAQAAEVVAQGRAGHTGRALDGAHGESVVPGPDQQAHDGQPGLVAELGEDGGGGFEGQSHEAGCYTRLDALSTVILELSKYRYAARAAERS